MLTSHRCAGVPLVPLGITTSQSARPLLSAVHDTVDFFWCTLAVLGSSPPLRLATTSYAWGAKKFNADRSSAASSWCRSSAPWCRASPPLKASSVPSIRVIVCNSVTGADNLSIYFNSTVRKRKTADENDKSPNILTGHRPLL